ncbi:MAG: hypothetical protein ACRCTU_16410, partial [Zoogloea sp.]|uniref:hypothetical protein n=1 Tax=Zoogloea sp. TaxID=49181 RepID=UPI003F404DB2
IQDWRGAERVFGWSFYSQGSNEDRHASEDNFLDTALRWFGVDIDPASNPADKGQALADELRLSPTLLVLDGLEPLQYPQGPMEGELRAPGLQALLRRISTMGMPGLILISSREELKDLQPQQQIHNPDGVAQRISLNNLSPQQGAQLLHIYEVCKAGEATIGPEDQELQNASVAVGGHALSLMLLGRYLALAHSGDVRQMDCMDWSSADDEIQNGHAFRVMRAYEIWLQRSGPTGQRQLAALLPTGFF